MNRHHRALIAALVFFSSLAFAQGLPPEQTAVVFGQNIRYYEAGQGSAVILLHGLGSSKEAWFANIAAVAAKYHVYAIDQIGFGHSDKPLLDYKIATFSDFLQGFMQLQNLTKATLVGNSLGGWIALDFAARHPDMVDKLVLVDSAGIPWSPAPTVHLNPSTLDEMREVLNICFYDKKFVTDEAVARAFTNRLRNNDGYTVQRTMAETIAEPQFETANLKSIKAPTLVVWGRQDELVPLSVGERLRDGIPGAKLVVLDQCGHIPQIEKAADFNRELLDFLGK